MQKTSLKLSYPTGGIPPVPALSKVYAINT